MTPHFTALMSTAAALTLGAALGLALSVIAIGFAAAAEALLHRGRGL